MSSFILKTVACICMFCDHFSDAIFNETTFLNYIGRFAFTIFAFQIVEGYINTHNLKSYIKRLSLFAFLSQIPFMLFYYSVFDKFAINVIFTLLFGLITILIYDKYNKFVGVSSCLFLGVLAEFFKFDYGFFGVFIIFAFYLFHNQKFAITFLFILSTILKYSISVLKYGISILYLFKGNPYSYLMLFSCLSIIPILLYNGQKGKDAKFLFYIFYPTHLFILSIIALLLK